MAINITSGIGGLRGRFPQEMRVLDNLDPEQLKQKMGGQDLQRLDPDGNNLPDRSSTIRPGDSKGVESFKDSLSNLVSDVDQMQKTAEEATHRMLTGELEDVHQVMIAMEEAQTSFQLMMEIRNKILEAYKEVIRMQV